MTNPIQSSQQVTEGNAQKADNKEYNFRMLEAKYERQLNQERAEREKLQKEMQDMEKKIHETYNEVEETDPYVDHKKLDKKLQKFGQEYQQQTQNDIQKAVQLALHEERKQNWLKNNGDFFDVMQHASKLAEKDPELAESILEMPESFERQKLVYKNIKAFNLHKPPTKEPSIQETIDSKRRSPYYQPTSVGSAPYGGAQADYSQTGQKNAYDKMQELKNRLRIN